jgi:hypothetical protein
MKDLRGLLGELTFGKPTAHLVTSVLQGRFKVCADNNPSYQGDWVGHSRNLLEVLTPEVGKDVIAVRKSTGGYQEGAGHRKRVPQSRGVQTSSPLPTRIHHKAAPVNPVKSHILWSSPRT